MIHYRHERGPEVVKNVRVSSFLSPDYMNGLGHARRPGMDNTSKPGCERALYAAVKEIYLAQGWEVDTDCAICRDEYQEDDRVVVLYHHRNRAGVGVFNWGMLQRLDDFWDPPMPHMFHYGCAGEWVRANDTCPTCRQPIDCEMLREDYRDQYAETRTYRIVPTYDDAGVERRRFEQARAARRQ